MKWSDAKQVIHDSFLTIRAGFDGGRSDYKGNLGKIGFCYEKGKIQDVIAKLPTVTEAFAMYCYAPDYAETLRHYRKVSEFLFESYKATYGTGFTRSLIQTGRIHRIFHLAMDERAIFEWSGEWMSHYKRAEYMQIHRQQWADDYKELYKEIQYVLHTQADQVLSAVWEVIDIRQAFLDAERKFEDSWKDAA